jgi:ubiquitin-like modifier-activating enzyme ATG7
LNSDQCPALIRADLEESHPEALSCLGIVPHTIRGFLGRYSTVLPTGEAFSQCVACSSIVEKRLCVYLLISEYF